MTKPERCACGAEVQQRITRAGDRVTLAVHPSDDGRYALDPAGEVFVSDSPVQRYEIHRCEGE